MKHTSKFSIALFVTFALLGALSASAADVDVSSNLLVWDGASATAGHQLSISGPNGVIKVDFAAGETPSLSAFGQDGNSLADGSYTWELRSIPVLNDNERGAIARLRAEGKQLTAAQMPKSELSWGYVSVHGGSFVVAVEEEAAASSAKVEGPTARAQTIATDLIVQGSSCVGIDCTSSESFGFDTIRLKENNLRIKFQDTSSSASFPGNDWQLTANDSGNGGANKFSIDDIDGGKTPFTIEAGAPSHSLYVDDAGNVGVNKSTPVVELHITDGDSPTVRLEQDGSSGFTPQTWDLAGNETNFFVRNVTTSSHLPFRILTGSGTDDAIVIKGDGNVGFGTDNPQAALHIKNTTGNTDVQMDTASQSWRWRTNGTTGQLTVIDNTNSTTPFALGSAADTNLLQVGVNGASEVTINGALVVTGNCSDGDGGDGGVDGCDLVFQPEYNLPSIEEHAEFMWTNSYLPAVGPTPEDAPWDLGRKSAGMLNELEKAHIYIDQLNQTVKALQERLEVLEGSDD